LGQRSSSTGRFHNKYLEQIISNRNQNNRILAKRQEIREVLDMIQKNKKVHTEMKRALTTIDIIKKEDEA